MAAVKIVCVMGPYGCGKTTVCDEFKQSMGARSYVKVIDEEFLSIDTGKFDSNTMLCGILWMATVMKRIGKAIDEGARVIVVDGGPAQGVPYRYGRVSYAIAEEFKRDLMVTYSDRIIHWIDMVLIIDEETHWKRVCKRLRALEMYDPEEHEKRVDLLEDSKEHFIAMRMAWYHPRSPFRDKSFTALNGIMSLSNVPESKAYVPHDKAAETLIKFFGDF